MTHSAMMPTEPDSEPTVDPTEGLVQSDLEVDDSVTGDSALGDDAESLSTSITSSVRNFRIEHGRTYHSFGKGIYVFPNDDTENDRLDLQHAIFLKSMHGDLYFAPLKDTQHVLDIGTGTGIWAIDFADKYPDATVIGTDLSPIQPSWIPPNLSFLIDDCEEEWIFDQPFDFIHARMMCGSLLNWPKFFEQAYRNTKPGGYIELKDIDMPFKCDDGSLNPSTALWQWNQYMVQASTALKRPMDAAHQYKTWLADAGFVDVVEVVQKWPLNNWPKSPKHKEIGLWMMQNMLQGLAGLTLRPLTMGLGMSQQEVEVHLVQVRKDVVNPQIRSYCQMHYVYARKPE